MLDGTKLGHELGLTVGLELGTTVGAKVEYIFLVKANIEYTNSNKANMLLDFTFKNRLVL